MMSCYECRSGREEYFNRPEDGKKTVGGLCRDCYERRVRELGEVDADKQFKKSQYRHVRQADDDEIMRDIEREDDALSALEELTDWR